MTDSRRLPVGSSAFAQAMKDVTPPPVVDVPTIDVTDNSPDHHSHKDHHHHHHEEGKVVHGLHHCYKIGPGHCQTSFRCNHDHARASNGHLEEISKSAGFSPLPKRRMSLVGTGSSLLTPEDEMFRPRANSDALSRRRNTVIANGGSPGGSPGKNSPDISPAPRRRGSNVILHSDELHYVYDQYLATKGKK